MGYIPQWPTGKVLLKQEQGRYWRQTDLGLGMAQCFLEKDQRKVANK